jgi:AcrR family transcriptional regulator
MYLDGQATGRVKQKQRTRDAILASAARLIAAGQVPTIEEVARSAAVSRATVYRYFPTREDLLIAATLEGPVSQLDRLVRSVMVSADPRERVDALVRAVLTSVLPSESTARAMLRAAVDPDVDDSRLSRQRGERRMRWVALALDPVRGDLPDSIWTRLLESISLLLGVEALVVLRDLLGLEPDEAVERASWTGRMLVAGALQHARESAR